MKILADSILIDTLNSRAADMTNPLFANFRRIFLPINNRFLWRASHVSMVALLFGWMTFAVAQPLSLPVEQDGMVNSETLSASSAPAISTKEILAILKEKLTNFQVTDNPDYDYATLLQILRQVGHDLAIVELAQGKDSELQRFADKEKSSSTKKMKNLSQWIERFHKFD